MYNPGRIDHVLDWRGAEPAPSATGNRVGQPPCFNWLPRGAAFGIAALLCLIPQSASAECGDGLLDASEGCDDLDFVDGDGCSATCEVEEGYACVGAPSVCAEAGPIFACSRQAYIGLGGPSQLARVDATVEPFELTDIGAPASRTYNAIGFNVDNGYLYGWDLTSQGNVVRIDAEGVVTVLGQPTLAGGGSPLLGQFNAGDVSLDERLYLFKGGTGLMYRIDLRTDPLTYERVTLSQSVPCFDLAINPRDGRGYCGDADTGTVFEIDLDTGAVQTRAISGTPEGDLGYGGQWFDALGRLYLYRNSGDLHRVDLTTDTLSYLGNGEGSTNNDGTACPIAAVFEKDASPRTLPPGAAVAYTFTLSHSGVDTDGDGAPNAVSGLTLSDTPSVLGRWVTGTVAYSTDGETFSATAPTGVTATVQGLGTSALVVSGIRLPATQDGLAGYTLYLRADFRIDTDATPGEALNQATLTGLPSIYGGDALSDDPITLEPDDPTAVTLTDPDEDGDGLTFEEETELGTDPLDPDSDDDGLTDGEENVGQDGLPNTGDETNPLDNDTDDDGLSDGEEVLGTGPLTGYGPTDPLDPDTDDDGLGDGLEAGVTAPFPGGVSDGNQIPYEGTEPGAFSPDQDGGTTTDPRDPDTDDDGLGDGAEDGDGDGAVDGDETDPGNPDTDDGGISDGFEVLIDGTDPLDPSDDDPRGAKLICTRSAYIGLGAPSKLALLDASVTPFELTDIGVPATQTYNAFGYNAADGYLYGWNLTTGNTAVRINANGEVTDLGGVVAASDGVSRLQGSLNAGDVSLGGYLYLFQGGSRNLFRVDLGATPMTYTRVTMSVAVPCFDLAINPKDGRGYCGDAATNLIYAIDLEGGQVTTTPVVGTPQGDLGYGAQWIDARGRLYLYRNSGDVHRVDLDTFALEYLGEGEGSTNNDGAGCSGAFIFEKSAEETVGQGGALSYQFLLSYSGYDDGADGSLDGLSGLTLQDTPAFAGTWLDGSLAFSQDGIVWSETPPVGVTATASGFGSRALVVEGISLPASQGGRPGFSLYVRASYRVNGLVEVGAEVSNQARLTGLPGLLGGTDISDDPTTLTPDDATVVTVVEGDPDADGDGLSVDEEALLGTDPQDADTDNDGLMDGEELLTSPLDADSDDDGLGDLEELEAGGPLSGFGSTDPATFDTDGDGLGDGLEVGVSAPIPGGLSDGAGVAYSGTDAVVFAGGDTDPSTTTDPLDADSDDDGLSDGVEDVNGDGARGVTETDPNNADTDGGGVNDGDEIANGTDPLEPVDDDGSGPNCAMAPGSATGGGLASLLLLGLAGLLRRRRD